MTNNIDSHETRLDFLELARGWAEQLDDEDLQAPGSWIPPTVFTLIDIADSLRILADRTRSGR